MGQIIQRFRDGAFLEYDRGSFDDWHVDVHEDKVVLFLFELLKEKKCVLKTFVRKAHLILFTISLKKRNQSIRLCFFIFNNSDVENHK